jgi:hypothetical protein
MEGAMSFAKFMSSGIGRIIRIIAGLILMALGVFFAHGTLGLILIIVGFIPLIAGVFDICVIGAAMRFEPRSRNNFITICKEGRCAQ